MFIVFLAGVMPKEYLHDIIHNHHDAVHPIYKKGEVAITIKHNHCSFLNFEFAPFLKTEQQFLGFTQTISHTTYVIPSWYFHYATPFSITASRGPPVIVFFS
jgi:hypothetical protein